MSDATFTCPDLSTFCGLDELGLEAVGQRLESDRAVLACRVTELDQWCRRCGCEGSPRDTLTRAAEPRARLSRRGLRWALEGIVVQHLTVARVAEGLGVSWNTANSAVLAEGNPSSRPAFSRARTGSARTGAPHDAIAEIHLLDSTR